MVIPKIERTEESRDYGKFTISPLDRGFGVTLGNALRRTLLSSLKGAAVSSVRITDVMHEFSTIKGVREGATISLDVKGEGTITAADLRCPPEVEVVNPDLYLFSINENDAHVEMDMTVESGRGYLPAGERADRLPIGVLPVDAIFSPVRRVNWSVTNARVGQSTNFDRLQLEIWTDGTLSPEKALIESSQLLMEQLRIISGTSEDSLVKPAVQPEIETTFVSKDVIETPIEALDLTVRVFNALKRTGITTVGDVLELLDKGESAMLSIRNFGDKSLTELKAAMVEKGYLEKEEEVE